MNPLYTLALVALALVCATVLLVLGLPVPDFVSGVVIGGLSGLGLGTARSAKRAARRGY